MTSAPLRAYLSAQAWAEREFPPRRTRGVPQVAIGRDPVVVRGEGDVVELVRARGATHPDFRMGIFSTSTRGNVSEQTDEAAGLTRWAAADPADVESPVWELWQEGTRYEWAWPCPNCGDYFISRFNLLR